MVGVLPPRRGLRVSRRARQAGASLVLLHWGRPQPWCGEGAFTAPAAWC